MMSRWIAVLTMTFGLQAQASLPDAASENVSRDQDVSVMLGFMNLMHNGLNVSVADEAAGKNEVLEQLRSLDGILNGELSGDGAEYELLACKRVECTGE